MDKNRFKQLLESTMGNVKPLVMEQVPSPEALTALKSGVESVFQFNKQYFEGAKTGVMILQVIIPLMIFGVQVGLKWVERLEVVMVTTHILLTVLILI